MDPWALGGVFGLVTGTIFKIAERQNLSLAGSIPVRLRHGTHVGAVMMGVVVDHD